MQIDPIQFEVIRNALLEATEEMAIALRRSAYSTNIKTRADFSCAFFDRDLRPVAQAFTQPVHLGSLTILTPRAVREYGPENLREGDAILVNDPYRGGVHLNDITLIAPVYCGGELFGYVANLAHHVDVGGGAPASIGAFQQVYQEGIIIPPVKLVEEGEIAADVFELVIAQIRSKRETRGDFRAQVAANHSGIRRLQGLVAQVGFETVAFYMDRLVEYTRERTVAELASLPRGEFAAAGVIDNDGFTDEPVKLAVRVVIDDDGVLFDLTGCDPQRRAPVNSTYSQTFAACAYVLKCLIDRDVPVNAGFYEQVRLQAPEATVVNCTAPSPVVGGWETQVRLTDIIFQALHPAMPERVPAATKGTMCQVGFGGTDPRSGQLYAYYETMAGGYGGRSSKDGPDAVQCHGQNTENAPIEEIEINYPLRIDRYELIENSEGAGAYRGGLGLRRDYRFPNHEVSFTVLSDRDRWGPPGLAGGQAGQVAEYILDPEGASEKLGSKVTIALEADTVFSYRTCGGGGYGSPLQRDPAAVAADVREGKVSAERAREIYGVVIEDGMVNAAATAALRKERGDGV
ncbi:MAG: 5-oxoprolinase [Gemmatimonadetes bacterium]|jgi:N-methylhydantoinase B|nr:5-oxoprolinase [Gemmatimonadota bacterium]|tara:strand:- start:3113 stop:4834 length:1722 start_codon:yes stop_codon:yes gene_type:complete